MSDNFARFLQQSFPEFTSTVENQFKSGLQKSSGTLEGLDRMTSSVFNTAIASVENENDKQALAWVSHFIKSMHDNSFEPKPRIRETLFFPSE
jgi:hypothetical protein